MKYEPRARKFIARRMHDFAAERMRSSSGAVVRSKKQALAIALAESRAKGMHVPKEKPMAKPRKGVIPPHLKPYLFKKKGKSSMAKKKHHRRKSTALTVYRPSKPVVITKTRHVKVPVYKHSKGGGRALMRREHGAGDFMPGPFRVKSMAVSAALGYAKGGHGLTQLNDLIEKLPTVGSVPKIAVAALLLNKFADRGDWWDGAAQAASDIAAYEFGQAGGIGVKGEDDE